MIKHGNISIEKVKKGYFINVSDGLTENKWAMTEEELHDLEICLHKLRGYEITESDKLWEKETKNF